MKKQTILFTGLILAKLLTAQDAFYKGAFNGTESFGPAQTNVMMSFWPLGDNPSAHAVYKVGSSDFNLYGEYGLSELIGVGAEGNFGNFYFNESPYINYVPTVSNANFALLCNAHLLQSSQCDLFVGISYGYSQLNYYESKVGADISGYGTWGDAHIGGRVFLGHFGIELTTQVSMANYSNMGSDKPIPDQYIPLKWASTEYGANLGLCYRIF